MPTSQSHSRVERGVGSTAVFRWLRVELVDHALPVFRRLPSPVYPAAPTYFFRFVQFGPHSSAKMYIKTSESGKSP